MHRRHDYAFLHGGVQGSWVWDDCLAALARQTDDGFGRALALDVPGCGAKRGRRTEGLDAAAVARELVADIERARMSDVVLVGHSQAGTVLPRMAELAPGLFRRLIYVSAVAPRPGETVLDEVLAEAEAQDGRPRPPPGERLYRQIFCNDMDRGQADAFLARIGEDAWPAQTYLETQWRDGAAPTVPASYVVCLRDATVSPALQETCARRLGASRLVRLDAGHQVMVTRPHALAEAVRLEADGRED